MNINRLKQIIKYGWLHAGQVSEKHFAGGGGRKRFSVFWDIIGCYSRYGMWSNQYVKEKFWELNKAERNKVGMDYKAMNQKREDWVKDFYDNRKFLSKWSRFSIEPNARKRNKRTQAYTHHYKFGEGAFVEYGVIITRQHYSDGTLTVGRNVLLARNVDIDYTGDLIISDGVAISEGAKILTHGHDCFGIMEESEFIPSSNRAYKTNLVIKQNVWIGSHAVIMPGVSEIGENSIVSAGSVVMEKVPANVVVGGNPAKIMARIPKSMRNSIRVI